jgi:hypothetical protein
MTADIKIDNVKIAILSQNAVNQEKFIEDIGFFGIDSDENKADIYVEMTQEDSRNHFTRMSVKLNSMVKDPALIVKSKYTNIVSEITRLTGMNIVTNAFISNALLEKYTESIGKVIVNKKNGSLGDKISTKGASYIKLTPNTPTNTKSILFVNMHLPAGTVNNEELKKMVSHNTNEAAKINKLGDEGYTARKTAFKNIITELTNGRILDNNTHLIIGGDLNFRVRYGHFITNESKLKPRLFDELTEYLKENPLSKNITELAFPDVSPKEFTCKLEPPKNETQLNKENLLEPSIIDNPSEETNDTKTKSDISNFIEQSKQVVYSEKRNPSRCDRFLTDINNNDTNAMEILKHGSTYFEKLKSDHQAIYAVIKLKSQIENRLPGHDTAAQIGGKKRRKNRKTKKSSKKRLSKLSRRRRRL